MMIRILQASDAEAYQKIRLEGLKMNPEAFGSTYEREDAFSLETVRERLTPQTDKFVLGAFDDQGVLMGVVTFVRDSGVKTSHKGNVFGMYVTEEMRGLGLGKALLVELIHQARTCSGLEQINLTVVAGNTAAQKLYESLGFERYGLERRALKADSLYLDEVFMVLQL